ncbi:PREDICTED: nudix hydrolase 11-like [Acropora digitifera]|uniref:nudix hydrolase 11-like n=1 Tax=Acropora digitifera TaxID=70779 RepID=UPI00077A7CCB|nr:PREDICTED: nudix hydrolase 11-like [Acropora digitifera]
MTGLSRSTFSTKWNGKSKKATFVERNRLRDMASPSELIALLDVCRTRIRNYAESNYNVNEHFKDQEIAPEFYKAGVLVPIFVKEGSLHVLLTKRTEHLPTHKGQVAFPGGKQEVYDRDIIATALREAHEEVGLSSDIVEVIAVLSPLVLLSRNAGTYVYPVIGLIKSDFDLVVNASEVQDTFDVPLEFFLRKDTYRYEKRIFSENEYDVHFFDYNQKTNTEREGKSKTSFVIWGMTSGVCLKIAIIALSKLPEFELPERYSELIFYIQEFNSEKNALKLKSKV